VLEWRDGRISFIRDYKYVNTSSTTPADLVPDAATRRGIRHGGMSSASTSITLTLGGGAIARRSVIVEYRRVDPGEPKPSA